MRRAAAWLAVAPWVVWAVARAVGLERGYPLVALMSFAPYAVIAGAAGVAISAVLRSWTPAVVGLAAAVVLGVGLLPRVHADGATDDGAQPGPHLRVLAMNTHLGEVPADTIVGLVRSTRADVLAVEELTPQLDRALADAGLGRMLPHRVAEPDFQAAGVGLYSRRALGSLRGPAMVNPAPAGILSVPGAPPVEFYAVHASAPFNRSQTVRWKRDLRALPPAASPGALRILAGDLNATLDHAELRRVLDTGYQDAAAEAGAGLHGTWPYEGRRLPPVTIDHVLADARCGVGEVKTFPLPGSDHRALFADVVLPAS